MDSRAAIGRYQEARETTRNMLQAAQAGDWEALVNLEIARRAALDPLGAHNIDFSPALAQEKDACINEILELDRQIRALTQAWMAEMRQTLASLQSQRKLAQAYAAG
jgi:uncharacterized membrane protein